MSSIRNASLWEHWLKRREKSLRGRSGVRDDFDSVIQ